MTTENTHPDNGDMQASAVEQLPASETPPTSDVAESGGEQVAATQSGTSDSVPEHGGQAAGSPTAEHDERHTQSEFAGTGSSDVEHQTPAIDTASSSEPSITPAAQMMAEEMFATTYPDQALSMAEGVVRPFTDFIEEFRQTEVNFGSFGQEPGAEAFAAFPSIAEPGSTQSPPVDEAAGTTAFVPEPPTVEEEQKAPAQEAKPVTNKERPVSPLLRPATRTRSRHGSSRQRESAAAATPERAGARPARGGQGTQEERDLSSVAQDAQTSPAAESAPAMPGVPQQEPATTGVPAEEQPKPARRYRFDRPAPTSPAVPTQHSVQPRPEEGKENRAPARSENGQALEREAQAARQNGGAAQHTEQQTAKQPSTQEPSAVNGEAAATPTPAPTPAHGRRHAQEHPHEKEKGQPSLASAVQADMTPATEGAESAAPVAQEVPPEELPPLEYSELQAATSRRRRRRRSGNASSPAASTTSTPASGVAGKPAPSEQPSLGSTTSGLAQGPTPMPASPVAVPRNASSPASAAPQYNIISGYTVSQMNQGNDGTGPFMGPEPSPARGSTISRESRPIRETQRGASHVARHGESMASPASVGQLANVISQAFQSQTDRIVAELRRANQVPTNVSVSFPPFPSTERVGVFVDVANLLYSARTQRLTIDFGKLLDFLRGNRRLVRAHAYCPTSPQPGDEQMFLQAVKGLGYRITTKNYKTFSSGAKKADLDLDLCMDVVRLVDGRAVDCIVLVSGDSDFMPMLDYCSDHGVRVEVAAFDESMSATLRQSCDLFINLAMLDEIRA
ncbi:MAG TPA: NYN domain-containing protein [Ktedonobacteraceae bacterium]|nr:NYN domain-containing protein [Ktedonobacteraceae bacterium]